MQSGISASEELRVAFQALLTTPSHRGLLATIKNEQVVPLAHIPGSSSFFSDLKNLEPHLDPKTPLYILLRRPDQLASQTSQGCIAVTYVPNAAHVRSKTLFASTRLTLVRDLGGEHFSDSLFVTEASELTADGWKAYEAHDEAAQPLTREEMDLEGIKEAEARERGGTSERRGHVKSGFAINVGDGVTDALEALKSDSGDNMVQLKFDVPTETLVLDSVTTATTSSVSAAISPSDPRYTFFRHPAGVLFIYTCPTASKIKDRMLYATSRQSVLKVASSVGLEAAKKLEATDTSDITAQTIDDEFKEQEQEQLSSARAGFARPKRPGKK